MKKPLILVAAAVVAALSGCAGKIVTGRVEKGIMEKLPELIGPAQSYDVNVDGGTGKLLKGKIPKLEIIGHGVRLQGMYYLDKLRILMHGLQANTGTHAVESIESTVFSAAITEQSLNNYLKETSPNLRELKISLQEGKMLVHTKPAISRFSASVDLTGSLKIDSGNKLRYVVDRLTVMGVKTPGFVTDYVEDRINPVLDFSKIQFPARLVSVTLHENEVTIDGTADLTKGMPVSGR